MVRGKPANQVLCCSCNGQSAKCKSCSCVKNNQCCFNCRAAGCTNKGRTHDTSSKVIEIKGETESDSTHDFMLGGFDTEVVESASLSLHDIYQKVIQWRPQAIVLPKCGISGTTIDLLAGIYESAVNNVEDVTSLEKAVIFARCVFQRPQSLKVSLTRKLLEQRIRLWKEDKISDLYNEARILQDRAVAGVIRSENSIGWERKYRKLMSVGRVGAATSLLDQQCDTGVLIPSSIVDGSSVSSLLESLHPDSSSANEKAILRKRIINAREHHPSLFLQVDKDSIIRAAKKTSGGAGPSGLDALFWKRMLTCFSNHSSRLAQAIADFAISLATRKWRSECLDPFRASRLIALSKKSGGIRPIGIGDVARRIICKAILASIKDDIQDSAGIEQLCASQRSGLEFAIHSLRESFHADAKCGLLAVDATNAFNSVNRALMLQNVKFTCPALAQIIENVYSADTELVLGGASIYSHEGVTQGDPLAMAAFAMATLPMIHLISHRFPAVVQRWYADDANFVGSPEDLLRVWKFLKEIGPLYGYNVNPSKTKLLLHESSMIDYPDFNEVHCNTNGIEVLGSPIGTQTYLEDFVDQKVRDWSVLIERLGLIANVDPHIAFVGLTHSLQWKWTHFLRTTPCQPSLLIPLQLLLRDGLLPKLINRRVDNDMFTLFSSPFSLGGLGISDPVFTSSIEFKSSLKICETYTSGLLRQDLRTAQQNASVVVSIDRQEMFSSRLQVVSSELPAHVRHAIKFSIIRGASAWLSALPLAGEEELLTPHEFRDAIAIRYGFDPLEIPQLACVCGGPNKLNHLLSCKRGGLPTVRHDAVRDFLASELSTVCHGVEVEPSLQPIDTFVNFQRLTTSKDDGARLDVMCCGFAGSRYERTFFDVCIFNHHAISCQSEPASAFEYHEHRKRSKYEERITDVERSVFIPIIFTAAGGVGPGALFCLRNLAKLKSQKTLQPYADCIQKLKRKIAFILCKSASNCIRGPRSRRNAPIRRVGLAEQDCVRSNA